MHVPKTNHLVCKRKDLRNAVYTTLAHAGFHDLPGCGNPANALRGTPSHQPIPCGIAWVGVTT